jgi:hypothetical protein
MGFFTTLGYLMTYNEYKEHVKCYKRAGLIQFTNLIKAHRDRNIEAKDLHWGEEIEYHLYSFREDQNLVLLSCDCNELLERFEAKVKHA